MCYVFCKVYIWPFHQGQSLDRFVAAEYPRIRSAPNVIDMDHCMAC